MKKVTFNFIPWATLLLVTSLAICSLLLSMRWQNAGQTHLNVPSKPGYVTTIDRSRPEMDIKQLLDLDASAGFNPDLTSLLKRTRERQRERANSTIVGSGQVASVPQNGGDNQ